jgi:hypothetical protein
VAASDEEKRATEAKAAEEQRAADAAKADQQRQASEASNRPQARRNQRAARGGDTAEKRLKLAEEQDKIGRQLRGDKEDTSLASLDEKYRENWVEQQRLHYPEIYRVADRRLASGGQPLAQPGAPFDLGGVRGLEPGHDPTLDYSKQADLGEETAGSDNVGPSFAATGTMIIPDSSLMPR